jgi:hypothetical protein
VIDAIEKAILEAEFALSEEGLSLEIPVSARAELAALQDKSNAYDLDSAGIDRRAVESAELVTLRADNERLAREKRDEFDIASGYHRRWQTAQATITEQAEQIAVLREALEFYADKDTWSGYMDHISECLVFKGGSCNCEGRWTSVPGDVQQRMGDRARADLSSVPQKER